MTVAAVGELAGGLVSGGDRERIVTGVSIDSRTVVEGDLFVALPGERVDGHAFVADAVRAGAAAALVRDDPGTTGGAAAIVVDDPLAALGRLAKAVREQLSVAVIAITGSSGKTITKEMTASVARTTFRTVTAAGSYNNEIGVPLTILAADDDTQVLVVEIGARGIGHIASLMPIVQPDVGVVLNVGTAHIGMFGSAENIAIAKGEIVETLDEDGVAVLNADDPVVDAMTSRTRAVALRFGSSSRARVRSEDVRVGDDGCASFTLITPDGSASVRLPIPGEHLVSDALAAAAAGHAVGVGVAAAAEGLAATPPPAWRMQISDAPGGWRVINDAYNANPASTAAALKTLAQVGRGHRTWAVLGEMAELGEHSAASHDQIGRLAVRLGVARVLAVGEETKPLLEAARLEGMTPEEATFAADIDTARAYLTDALEPGDVVLVKASRAAGLERLAAALSEGGAA